MATGETAMAETQSDGAADERMYDVLVVGGGPAGLAAAEAAARTGVRVALLERQKEIGYPVHTSGGSWISDMRALGLPAELYHPLPRRAFLWPDLRGQFS